MKAMAVTGDNKERGVNKVRISGVITSAPTSHAGVLARRIEVFTDGVREIIDIECEKGDIFPIFRALRIGQWVSVEGSLRKRFWRRGPALASRSYVHVNSLKPGMAHHARKP